MGVQMPLGGPAFNSFGCITRNGILGSYSNSVFSFLRNRRSIFHHGWAILRSHSQCTKFLVPLLAHEGLLLSAVLVEALLMGLRRYLVVVGSFLQMRQLSAREPCHLLVFLK